MKSYKIAIACALLPMIVGVGIFLLWLITRAEMLMLLGMFTVFGGIIFFLIGVISLGIFIYTSRKTNTPYKAKAIKATRLLVLNFPLAIAIMAIASYLYFVYDIIIINQSSAPATIEFTDPAGDTYTLAPIAPGATIKQTFRFGGEGAVKYTLHSGKTTSSGTAIGYVSAGINGPVTMVVQKNGTLEIEK